MGANQNGYAVRRVGRGAPLLLVFDGAEGPSNAFAHADLWEGIAQGRDRPCGLVLLRDGAGAGYYRGVAGLGSSIDETAVSLRSLIAELAPTEVITCGSGLGGHASLVFGTLLGARRIVAVEPVAHLIAEELTLYNDRRWQRVLARLPEPSPAREYAVPTLMASCRFNGHGFVLFGTGRGVDLAQAAHLNLVHAQWLARSDRVTLCPFPEVWQDLIEALSRQGKLESVLKHYLFAPEDPPRGGHRRREGLAGRRVTANHCVVSLFRAAPGDGPEGTELLYAAAGIGEAPEIRKVDDEIRRWIAENLMIGQTPESIARRMMTIGFSEPVAVAEVRQATENPYVRGAVHLQNRLKKRDWLLSVYRKLRRLRPGSEQVEHRHKLSRATLFAHYYTENRPVVITGMFDDGAAPSRWSLDDLAQRFGDKRVKIRFRLNETNNDDPYRAKPTQIMAFVEYVEMIRRSSASVDFGLTTEDPENQDALSELWDNLGRIPEYLDGGGRLAGSFRLDPAGSFTPFRHEFTNQLLALALGKLRVKLVPSWDLPLMRNTWQALSELDGRQTSAVSPIELDQPQVLECVLNQGELLLIPVGCWFFVQRIEASVTATAHNFVFDNDFPSPDALPLGT